MRTGYRVQYVMTMIAALTIVGAIPAATMLGTVVYHHLSVDNARLRAILRTVDATLDADAQPGGQQSATSSTQAHWVLAGAVHTGTISADAGARAGDRQRIWVRPDGSQASAPLGPGMIAGDAVGIAVAVFAGVVTAAVTAVRVCGRLLDRQREASWGREWSALAVNRRWNRL
jgi:hypothetical protein